MRYEVEQKFQVTDLVRLENALGALGAIAGDVLVQVDQYWNHPARDFALTDEALRIRRVGEQNFVTYKGPKLDATTKTRRELELPIAGGEMGASQFAELLLALGFLRVAEVRKTRRPFEIRWQNQNLEVALDQVAGIGSFVELELMVEATGLEQAKACLISLATELGLAESERRSYLELLLGSDSRQ